MDKVISIYEAKTNFSKYVKKAQAGHTIYVGAYGTAQAIIAPLPAKKPIKIGVYVRKKKANAYDPADLIGHDPNASVGGDNNFNGSK
ncbi:MAG TPA: hypothetical protein VK978_02070 [Candidatus Saccharimonadales bacterium]|nr:hypothetical protein [Candidatus Saccharimonadales bacterium]